VTARTVLQPADITRALTRISHEILESVPAAQVSDIVILGIPTRGVVLARRIGALLTEQLLAGQTGSTGQTSSAKKTGSTGQTSSTGQTAQAGQNETENTSHHVPVGALDVTMYRDDLSRNPTRAPARTEVPSDGIDGKIVVLVDDVLYSGRTIRAALDALSAIGRPRYVRLATLVDRGHRELPIRPDFVGKNLPTADGERIHVRLDEIDGIEEVTIES
jgi:pyrimidine operon attenuation protein/uracil phosphoribosyltransferase